MKMCIVCGERKAELPDRNVMGRPIKRVCKECHAGRLRSDIQAIMLKYKKEDEK